MANIVKFAREVRQEASKVTWPSRRETIQATMMVFAMVVLAAIFFLATDTVLGFIVRKLLGLASTS